MRSKHRFFMISGMLAGVVALGCQAPAVTPQGVTAGTPRTVVHFGAVKLEPDADMAIVLNRTDCAERDFSLKQVNGPDPRVDHIIVEITGPGLVEAYKKTITRSQFTGCDATLNLTGLAPGAYNVRFTSYNVTNDPVAYANGSATVALGTTPQLNLVCDFNLGALAVNIHCCDDTTPTPVPSGTFTPTPVPTMTPTPVPTPTPANPDELDLVYGINADAAGRVYVAGQETPPPTGFPAGYRAYGKIVKVEADKTIYPSPFYDNVGAPWDTEIIRDANNEEIMLIPGTDIDAGGGSCAFVNFVRTSDGTNAYTRFMYCSYGILNLTFDRHVTLSGTTDPRTNVLQLGKLSDRLYQGPMMKQARDVSAMTYFQKFATSTVAEPWHTRYSDFIAQGTPIWTCQNGIVQEGPSTGVGTWDPPVVLATPPATHAGNGFIGLQHDGAGRYYVTLDQDPQIYVWNPAGGALTELSPNPMPDAGYPRAIVQGQDGYYYVLSFEEQAPAIYSITDGARLRASANYRVHKFSQNASGGLDYVATQVSTY